MASSPGSNSQQQRNAFVTFLAGDGDYVKGALGLAKSLRMVRSAYKLIVAVLPDVPEQHRLLLLRQGCLVREIQPVSPPRGSDELCFAMAHYVINYSKLRIWEEFDDYNKLVYLDADMMVFENVDELFDMPAGSFYAVKDCFCEPPKQYFNAGMCVLEPSRDTFKKMMQALDSDPPTPFAEQDFLNMFFQDAFKPIPNVYNLVLAMLWRHPENVDLGKIKVVHYCATGSKPWAYTGEGDNMEREDVKELVRRWWDVYNREEQLQPLLIPLNAATQQKRLETPQVGMPVARVA